MQPCQIARLTLESASQNRLLFDGAFILNGSHAPCRLTALAAFIACCAFFVAACSSPLQDSSLKIVGGRVADEQPFMAGLTQEGDDSSFCGGAFIAPRIVVTAAHCVVGQSKPLFVSGGLRRNSEHASAVKIAVEAVRVHPDYDQLNDIALLFLAPYQASALPGPVKAIDLNEDSAFPDAAQNDVTVIGWGNTTSYGDLFEDELHQVTLPVVPLSLCKTAPGYDDINPSQICAGHFSDGGADSCQGDSGGPLIATKDGVNQLVGIVSWGDGCALAKKMGVYTRVSSFVPWIKGEIARFQAVTVEPAPEILTVLQKSFCYLPLSQVTSSTLGGVSIRIGQERSATGSFVPAPMGIQNQSRPPASDPEATCLFSLPNGKSYEAVAGPDKQVLLAEAGTGRQWLAPGLDKVSVSMSCAAGRLALAADERGFSYAIKGSDTFYVVGPSPSYQAGANFHDVCKAGDHSFKIVPSGGHVQAGVTNLLVVREPALGAHAVAYELAKVGAGGTGLLIKVTPDPSSLMGSKGTFSVKNTLDEDVHTWELRCSERLALRDFVSNEIESEVLADDHVTPYSFKFVTPRTILGTIRAGAAVNLKYEVASSSIFSRLRCTINGEETVMDVSAFATSH